MAATATVVNPDSIDVTITLTFTLGRWKKIREVLEKDQYRYTYPISDVTNAIRDVVHKAEKTFYAEPDKQTT